MNVNMTRLGLGALAALLTGACLWLVYLLCTLLALFLFGRAREKGKGRARRVGQEVFLSLFCLAFAFFAAVFVYHVNGGVVRWFLIGGLLLGFLVCLRYLQGGAVRVLGKLVLWLRAWLLRCALAVLAPVRWLCRTLGRICCLVTRKIRLRVWALCDTLHTKKFDAKKRRYVRRGIARDLERIS